ncbi:uncharacterized protein LAJ45_10274 [Morchella importuna]|uniref:uncharacterized protein n=1 Tax=Morchella importuna TaxID=1174673 RepID=UPI001E8D0375|nr:uncharacterized protein LAJ45_10274 [Morchella importuna]KAH8145634.1 hypothetical protein LAJ45_10274 [Morchella importuna]
MPPIPSNTPIHHTIHVRPPPCKFLAGPCFCTHPATPSPPPSRNAMAPTYTYTPDSNVQGSKAANHIPGDLPILRSPMRPTRGSNWRDQVRRQVAYGQAAAQGSGSGSWDEVMGDVSSRMMGGERVMRRRVRVVPRDIGTQGKGVTVGSGGGGRKEVVGRDEAGAMWVDGFYKVSAAVEKYAGAAEAGARGISNNNGNGGGQEHERQNADNGDQERTSGRREEASKPTDAGVSGAANKGYIYISSSESEDEGESSRGGICSGTISPAPNPGREDETGSIFDLPADYVLPSGAEPTVREKTQAQDERTLGMMRFLKMRKAALFSEGG